FDLWESNARPSRYRCSSTHASGSALLVNFEELGFHLSEETGRSRPLRRPNTPAAPFLGRARRQPPAPEIVVADNEPRSGLGDSFQKVIAAGMLRVHLRVPYGIRHHRSRIRCPMGPPCRGDKPVVVVGRHQHQVAPPMPDDLDRLALGLVLELTEFALKFDDGRLSHCV